MSRYIELKSVSDPVFPDRFSHVEPSYKIDEKSLEEQGLKSGIFCARLGCPLCSLQNEPRVVQCGRSPPDVSSSFRFLKDTRDLAVGSDASAFREMLSFG